MKKAVLLALAGLSFAACGDDGITLVEQPRQQPCFTAEGKLACGEGTVCDMASRTCVPTATPGPMEPSKPEEPKPIPGSEINCARVGLIPILNGQAGHPGDNLSVAKVDINPVVDVRLESISVEAFGGFGAVEIFISGNRPSGGGQTQASSIASFEQDVNLPAGTRYLVELQAHIVPNARTSQKITLIVRAHMSPSSGAETCGAPQPFEITIEVLEPKPAQFPQGHPCLAYMIETRPWMIALANGSGQPMQHTDDATNAYFADYKFVACVPVSIRKTQFTIRTIGSSDGTLEWAGLVGPSTWNVSPFRLTDAAGVRQFAGDIYPHTTGNPNPDERVKVVFDNYSIELEEGAIIEVVLRGDAGSLPVGFANHYDVSPDFIEVINRDSGQQGFALNEGAPQTVIFVGQ